MIRSQPRRVLAAAFLAASLAAVPSTPVRAGDDMPGKWYENKIVGFRFKPLNEWAAVPPGTDPRDPKLCGFYSDKAKFEYSVKPECSVYAFKIQRTESVATEPTGAPTPPPDGPGGGRPTDEDIERMREEAMDSMRPHSVKEVLAKAMEWRKQLVDQVTAGWDEKKRKKVYDKMKIKDPVEKVLSSGEESLILTEMILPVALTNGELLELHVIAGTLRGEEYEIGVVYEIPGSERKKYTNGVLASIRSLEFLSGASIAEARKDLEDALAGKTGDERWLEEIKRKVGPGWAHFQTKNYLIVHDKAIEPERVKQVAVQIEAIRKDVYEVLFPADRPVTAISVVRFCKDDKQYFQYGGPSGSAGYWNSGEKELVFYEDKSAKADSLRVLNHEAFHQYIFYSVGSISPHDWFNEGHGDYFSGHNYDRSGRFIPKPFSWRTGIIKTAMGSKTFVPLKTFVKFSHAQYYGPQIGQNYAQGWSLIWFLRGTKNPEWKSILPTYFDTLKGEVTRWVDAEIAKRKADGSYKEGWKPEFTPDNVEEEARSKALNAAFGSFDDRKWEKFEKEWLAFKY